MIGRVAAGVKADTALAASQQYRHPGFRRGIISGTVSRTGRAGTSCTPCAPQIATAPGHADSVLCGDGYTYMSALQTGERRIGRLIAAAIVRHTTDQPYVKKQTVRARVLRSRGAAR